jgi:hypothetical protein
MNKSNYFFIFLIIFNFVLIIYLIVLVNSEAGMCTTKPFNYGFEKLQEANKDKLECSCYLLSKYPSPTFHFNETSTWFINPPVQTGGVPSPIDISPFIFSLNSSLPPEETN